MDEYIEREALMIALSKEIIGDGDYYNGKDDMQDEIRDMVSRFPAADVAPVRHGRWVFGKDLPCNWGNHHKNKYHLYCSECLEQAFNRSEDNDPDFDVETPYCPTCGCCIDGGAD